MSYPIILVPGIAHFDFLRSRLVQRINILLSDRVLTGDRTHYFRRIRPYLRENGFDVEHADTGFAEHIDTRADRLAASVLLTAEKYKADKVHIIGHSMGGLDARHMVVAIPQVGERVASITTIGTPHHGTPFADYFMEYGADKWIEFSNKYFYLDFRGFLALTTEATSAFNERAAPAEVANDVQYFTYTAYQEREKMFEPLKLTWQYVYERQGDNDGLVSCTSQAWGTEIVGENGRTKSIHQRQYKIGADHLNQVGWWDINEWQSTYFWQSGLLKQRYAYEQQIRDTYLKIAQETADL